MALPEAEEKDHFGRPSFRVRGKIYAQLALPGAVEQRAVLKLALADQTALILSAPEVFSAVPQWGMHGWTYVRLDGVDRLSFGHLLRQAWMGVAPKKLVTSFEAEMASQRG